MRHEKPTVQTMTVGERIRIARTKLGVSQVQLAKRLGVSKGAVSGWENDEFVVRAKWIPKLASILDVEPSLLSPFGGGTVAPIDKARKSNYVVLLSWEDLGALGAGNKMKMSSLKKPRYIEVDLDISADCKALRIVDNSMEAANGGKKTFHKGDMIIIDPNKRPGHGGYVLVRIKQTGEHLFRQFVERSATAYDLVALNPDYPTVTINTRFPAEMLGVLVEHRQKSHT